MTLLAGRSVSLLLLPAVMLVISCNAIAQAVTHSYSARAGEDLVTLDNLPIQKIGSGDLLLLSTTDCPELTRSFRVASDGFLSLPLLANPVQASGMYPADLARKIKSELIAAEMMTAPIVTVSIIEYRSHPVSVVGAVNHPLIFQAVDRTTLLDAIARAGGLSNNAGSHIIVSRNTAGDSGANQQSISTIPVTKLLDQASAESNLLLSGGEEIRVPEGGKVFVAGNVRKPGAYLMQDNSDTTFLKVLALSEGVLPYSTKQAFIYRRSGVTQERKEIVIELDKVVTRKSPDLPVMPDDILYVPVDKRKRLTVETLDRMANFGSSTASGMLVWRR
jgi:polysaccharide biosynthesis/export protein